MADIDELQQQKEDAEEKRDQVNEELKKIEDQARDAQQDNQSSNDSWI